MRLQHNIAVAGLSRTEGGLGTGGCERHAAQRPPPTTGSWLQSYLILTQRPGAISQGRSVEKSKGTEQMEIVARGRSNRWGFKTGSSRSSPPRHLMGGCEVLDRGFPVIFPITWRTTVLHIILEPYSPQVGQHRQPRHNRGSSPPGGARTRFEGVSRGSTSTVTECLAQGQIVG